MRTVPSVANPSHSRKRLYLALIGFAALSLPACNASKPAETAPTQPAVTAPAAANGASSVPNRSAGARARAEDAKVDGP